MHIFLLKYLKNSWINSPKIVHRIQLHPSKKTTTSKCLLPFFSLFICKNDKNSPNWRGPFAQRIERILRLHNPSPVTYSAILSKIYVPLAIYQMNFGRPDIEKSAISSIINHLALGFPPIWKNWAFVHSKLIAVGQDHPIRAIFTCDEPFFNKSTKKKRIKTPHQKQLWKIMIIKKVKKKITDQVSKNQRWDFWMWQIPPISAKRQFQQSTQEKYWTWFLYDLINESKIKRLIQMTRFD